MLMLTQRIPQDWTCMSNGNFPAICSHTWYWVTVFIPRVMTMNIFISDEQNILCDCGIILGRLFYFNLYINVGPT